MTSMDVFIRAQPSVLRMLRMGLVNLVPSFSLLYE